MTDARTEARWDRARDERKHAWRPGDPLAQAPLDAWTVTQLARATTTSFDEAMHLIEGYANLVAADAVIKALNEAHARTMKILGGPVNA